LLEDSSEKALVSNDDKSEDLPTSMIESCLLGLRLLSNGGSAIDALGGVIDYPPTVKVAEW
jgi:hypothetical protein